ncbi:hypothetical protein RFI_00257 [Reticulomyxa filosa]|uniref:DSBA-like thioredoxin domain-containing protein n=1 Tax=Reticulomyxa filosa TaxID=46433 RepID=X6PF31_RETFI|nr:hypothetical protein RFI_00257 [Reticulomyxa filosa]|eukprot:ETO36806.1 hypothetical protein RFI_00257 [Reticulomyxa filosa]
MQIANRDIIGNEEVKTKLREETDKAVKNGIFGVPTFVINNSFDKDFYFGMDRLPYIETRLRLGLRSLLRPPIHRIAFGDKGPSTGANKGKNKIEVFFDFASPWTFLAYLRGHELRGFGEVEWKPVLLGAIFKSIGTPNAPILALTDAKRNYMSKEMARWFSCNGSAIKFSSHFPLRTILPLRVYLADNRTIDCIFRGAWQYDLNISNAEVLSKLLDENGFDGKALIAKTEDPKIKQALQDNTAFALDKGIFGLPMYAVNGDYDRIVWGQDRIDFVKDICKGWKPPVLTTQFAHDPKTRSSKL